jgi:hypothetical protein
MIAPRVRVFKAINTKYSRDLAQQVLEVAKRDLTAAVSTGPTSAPRRLARRYPELKIVNKQMINWCCEWIKDEYGTNRCDLRFYDAEPHIISYKVGTHLENLQTQLLHNDKSYVTIMMALSEPEDYTGGGTYFPYPNDTVHLKQGDVLMFGGGVMHRAKRILTGERHLYIVFVHLKNSRDPRYIVETASTPKLRRKKI